MSGRAPTKSLGAAPRALPRPVARALPLALVALLLLTVLLAAACDDDATSPDDTASPGGTASPSAVDAGKILQDAAAKMSTDGFTAHIAFGTQLVFDGPDLNSTFTATGSGDLEMPTKIRYVIDVTADDSGGALEVVTIDGVDYYTRDANDTEQPWSVSDSPMAVPFDLGKEIVRYLSMATQTEVVKTSVEGGQGMMLIRVTMDPLQYARGREELDMEAAFAQTFGLSVAESEKALAKGLAIAEFKVGEDDGYVHDLTERWLVRLEGGNGFLQEVALAFSRFGKPIEPPIVEPQTD
ncbi:MAG: hypothetical protein JW767_09970 [Thermoleophilia bacterium]|nr:hypothetical protein [Thermoleophilia bacterium]